MIFQTKFSAKWVMLACFVITSLTTSFQPGHANDETSATNQIESTISIHRMKRDQQHHAATEEICRLRIDFGSYASGIDGSVFTAVMSLITHDPAISEVYIFPWGREGERTFCIANLSDEDAEKLFEMIKLWIPEESRNGPTKITFGEKSYSSKWPN